MNKLKKKFDSSKPIAFKTWRNDLYIWDTRQMLYYVKNSDEWKESMVYHPEYAQYCFIRPEHVRWWYL